MDDTQNLEDDGPWDFQQLQWNTIATVEEIDEEEEIIAEETSNIEDNIRILKPQLSLDKRRLIVDNLLAMQVDGKLPRGFQRNLARDVGVHKSTISRMNKDIQRQRAAGNVIDIRAKKAGRCGRKGREYSDEWLQSCPLHLRTTVRAFAGALRVPHITIYRLLKKGKLRSYTSSNHPTVTEKHKLERMKWVLSHIRAPTPERLPTYVDMQNVIHIDEKWFYLNPEMRRFYLLPYEDDPYRCCQSKRYRIKVMFLGVIGRPIYNDDGTLRHDGKYGIFPFIYHVAAKKSSKNRAAGTIETKAVQNVTQEVIRAMLIEKVIPAIMAKWPAFLPKHILLQQDNARPHIPDSDVAFKHAATQNGFHIQLVFQPPQSPDLNLLDLCLFRSIQSIQHQSFPKNLDELIEKVHDAYDNYDPHKIKFAWLQLQYVMTEILKVKGGNGYKNPHNGKARLERIGQLPSNVQVEQSIVDEAVQYLNERLVPVSDNIEYFDQSGEVDAD